MTNLQLHTDRLILKPYTSSQAGKVSELAGGREVTATTFVPHPYTLEHASEWIELHKHWIQEKKAFPLAMMKKDTKELVGTMTLRVDLKHHKGELAYWVGNPYWKQGFATEAAQKIIEFGFNEIQLQRIWSAAMTENPASVKVMQKAGLSYEGTLKKDIYHWNEYKDIDVYGLIKEDYEQQ